jgi:hypothetical protein
MVNLIYDEEFKNGITTCLINRYGDPLFGDVEKFKTEMHTV